MSYKASQTELVPRGAISLQHFRSMLESLPVKDSDQDLEPGGGTERRGVQVLREGCFVGGNGTDF